MILYLAQSVFIVSIFYIVYKLILKRFTFFNFNRTILLMGIALAFVLPLLPLNFSPEQTEYVYIDRSELNALQNTAPLQTINTELSSSPTPWWQEYSALDWVFLAYWIGFAMFFLNIIIQLIMVFVMMRNGKGQYKEGVKLIFTNKDVSPFSFFSNIIVNPNQVSEHQWDDVIVHEKVHISQWHQFDVVLAELLKAALWFNPISWWYAKEIRTNLEYIADDISIQNGLNRKNYQLSLVQISQQTAGPQLVNSFSKKIVKNRIKMLNKMKSNRNALAAYSFILPALLGLSLLIATKAQGQEKKVKKVIVLTEDGEVADDVKVTYKNKDGETVVVNQDEIEVIDTSVEGNVVVDTDSEDVIIEVDEDGIYNKIVIDTEKIIEDAENGSTSKVYKKVYRFKDGDRKVIELDENGNDSIKIIVNGETIELGDLKNMNFDFDDKGFEFFMDSLDIDVDNIKEQIGKIEFDTDALSKAFVFPNNSSEKFFFHLDDHGELNISEEEYNKLSKKQKRQLDKIKKELEQNRKDGKSNALYFKSNNNSLDNIFEIVAPEDIHIISSNNMLSYNGIDEDSEIIIDGKKSSYEQFKKLKPENIKKIDVNKNNNQTTVKVKTRKAGKSV